MKKTIFTISYIIGWIGSMIIFVIPITTYASDIFDTTDYMLFNYIPHLIIPFLFALLLIGFITRFVRNGMQF